MGNISRIPAKGNVKERKLRILGKFLQKRKWPDKVYRKRLGFSSGELSLIRAGMGITRLSAVEKVPATARRRVVELAQKETPLQQIEREIRKGGVPISWGTVKQILKDAKIKTPKPGEYGRKNNKQAFDAEKLFEEFQKKHQTKKVAEIVTLYGEVKQKIADIYEYINAAKRTNASVEQKNSLKANGLFPKLAELLAERNALKSLMPIDIQREITIREKASVPPKNYEKLIRAIKKTNKTAKSA